MVDDKKIAIKQSQKSIKKPQFILQWHLTARCEQKCAHCYMREEVSYKEEIEKELSYKDCLKVLNDYLQMVDKLNASASINFTGGDPLLKPELFDLIKESTRKGVSVGILGNPNLLTPQIVKKLKNCGLVRYQLSLDGLEKTHDRLRGRKGLFKDTLRAIEVLQNEDIRTLVMFTLSKENSRDLIPLIRLVAKLKVSLFDFARLVPVGSGKTLMDAMMKPQEYRELLLAVLEEYKRFEENDCFTYFGRKDHLWNLLYEELGLFQFPRDEDKNLIYGGCNIGNNILSLLADGTVYACRRLPIKIGKVPEESIWKIFFDSQKLDEMRKIEKMKKCGQCKLLRFCRGCPAVAFGANKSYFAADPQCWRETREGVILNEF